MDDKKRKLAIYQVDFITALDFEACRERLERQTVLAPRGLRGWLAPITQVVDVLDNRTFAVRRTFPGAIHPIRLAGCLDPDEESDGTWVHGAITHDTANQVLIEGMIVFLTFFLLTALLFLRLKTSALVISFPLLLVLLLIFSIRWRALGEATEDAARWVRRRLYVTADQVK